MLGLLGSQQLEPTETLLSFTDDLHDQEEYQFNGSVMRRSLKSLVNDDFKLCAWEKLTTSTKKIIDDRYILDSDDLSADGCYIILCSQIMQKMLRTVGQKFKPKESNCQQHYLH